MAASGRRAGRTVKPAKSPEISLRLDGGDVHPHNVDPSLVLSLASAYVDALRALAATSELDLDLRGLEIRDRCVEVAFGVNKLALAKQAAQEVGHALVSPDRPRGAIGAIDRLRDAIGSIPSVIEVTIQAGSNWKRSLRLRERDESAPALELATLRATPLRAGGATPVVRFQAEREKDFSLAASEDLARQLGAHLYREVELEAEIARDETAAITDGRVLGFEPVDQGDAGEAWDNWFQRSAGEWDDESVEALIGGRRD